MEIKFNTVKKMLLNEYTELFTDAKTSLLGNGCIADAAIEMLEIGYDKGREAIESAETWEALNDAIKFCGYRMSLQEWLDSY